MATAYTIQIHAIPLSDNNGGRKCTVTAKAFAEAIATVNEIFSPANIRFSFDAKKDWHPKKSTKLNNLNNGGSKWWTAGNKEAAKHRGQFTVFLRWGKDKNKPANNWFAYPPNTGQTQPPLAKLPTDNVDFIAITNRTNKFGSGAGKVLAHEIGHFLGLFHTHPGWGVTSSETVKSLVKDQGKKGLNGDLLSDTAPDPCTEWYQENVSTDRCGGPSTCKIAGKSFTLDRDNLMGYFRCRSIPTLSKKQVAVIRKTITHDTRKHLIEVSVGVRYSGVFRRGSDAHALWVGDDWEGFEKQWKSLSRKGLRLIDLETYVIGKSRRYAGVYRAGTGKHALWVGDTWKEFEEKWKELSAKGLRLIDLETYKTGRTRRYAGVFIAGSGGHALWVGDTWSDFNKKWEELSKKGLRLIDLETWVDGKTRRYAGVFRAGRGGHALWVGVTWPNFNKKWKEFSDQGLRLIDLETWVDGKTRRYAGVFGAGRDKYALWINDDWYGFNQKWEELSSQGLRLIDLEVHGKLVD